MARRRGRPAHDAGGHQGRPARHRRSGGEREDRHTQGGHEGGAGLPEKGAHGPDLSGGSKRTAPTSPTYRWTRRSRGGVADAGPAVRPGTKQAQVIDLLRRPQGASIAELVKATGWQQHSVRGAIALKKMLGLAVTSKKAEDGERRYWI